MSIFLYAATINPNVEKDLKPPSPLSMSNKNNRCKSGNQYKSINAFDFNLMFLKYPIMLCLKYV